MPETTYAWAPITKTEEQEDGTLLVYGPAASSDLDRDQQRLNADWLDRAMPEWAQTGNIREQHDSKRAVGVGVGLTKTDDGKHHIAAHIVDSEAVKKIKNKVLKGFSVGIKGPRVAMGKADAPGGEIVDGTICEISVVDRPCNPTTLFEIAKADTVGDLEAIEGAQVTEKSDAEAFGIPADAYERLSESVRAALNSLAGAGASVSAKSVKADETTVGLVASPSFLLKLDGLPISEDSIRGLVDQRVAERLGELGKADLSAAGRKKAASGAAMSDGSYPINTKADLRKAIKAVGRGGTDHDKIRKHIVTRARALGLENLVPDNWNSDGSLKTAAKADEPDAATLAATAVKAEQILRDARALAPSLVKADDGDESADIATAEEAIAAIARLIIAEAESLAQGNLNEAMDISLLLDAVRSLTWFKAREEREGDGDDDAVMGLADKPDAVKAAAKKDGKLAPPFGKKKTADDEDTEDDGDESDEDDAEDGDGKKPAKKKAAVKADAGEGLLTKAEANEAVRAAVAEALAATAVTTQTSPADVPETVTKAELADMVKTAVAEATAAAEERTNALAADLAKATGDLAAIKQLPTPGGPALTRTAAQQAEAVKSDADRLRAQADELLAKADRFSGNRDLAQGYKERARELLAKADA